MTADSRMDTYEHIAQVRGFIDTCVIELLRRGLIHDASKLETPEREAYDGLGERLREHEYGSEGYKSVLREIKPAIKHHYEGNSHHPEHYENGIQGMSLIDVLEMLCDWKAASLRQGKQGSIYDSLDHNQERFGFSDDVKALLFNTIPLIEGGGPCKYCGEMTGSGDPLVGMYFYEACAKAQPRPPVIQGTFNG